MRKLKISGFVLIVLVLSTIIGTIAFFFSTEAPLTKGEVKYHIPYNKDLTLDMYFPTQDVYQKRPVVLYIHGGAWVGGSKKEINFNRFNKAINQLRDSGYVVVSSSYTLAEYGKSPFPKNIADCYRVINWLKNNAEEYYLDTNHIGLLGESAGAHISMMLAFCEPSVYGVTGEKPEFDYLIDIYGPNDLMEIYQSGLLDTINASLTRLPNKIQNRLDLTQYLLGYKPKSDTINAYQTMKHYSPIRHLKKGFDTPILIIQGDKDRLVPVNQSLYLKIFLDSIQSPNEIHILENVDHAFLGASISQKDSIQTWIKQFVLDNTIIE